MPVNQQSEHCTADLPAAGARDFNENESDMIFMLLHGYAKMNSMLSMCNDTK